MNKCKHCEFIENTFKDIQSDREYWQMTEVFVYLHGGLDSCSGCFEPIKEETKVLGDGQYN